MRRIATDSGADASVERPVEGVDRRDARRDPGWQRHDRIAGADSSTFDPTGVGAVVLMVAAGGPDDPLDREPERARPVDRVVRDRFEKIEQRRPIEPGHRRGSLDDVVAAERRDRNGRDIAHAEAAGEAGDLVGDGSEGRLVEADEVHLVDRDDQPRDAEQGGDDDVPAGLLQDAGSGVDEDHRQVRGRAAGDHVAGVLEVTRRIGHDELAAGRLEVAVGDVDRDPLLALGAQAVGQQGEVEPIAAAASGRVLEGDQLVLEDALGIVEEPADQRALAVVDRSGRREAEEVGGRVRPMRRPGCRRGHQK